MNAAIKDEWRKAFWLAVVAAIILEFVINFTHERTIWQRIGNLEQRVEHLETLHEQQRH